MKTIIVLAAVLTLFISDTLHAQSDPNVSFAVAAGFNREFKDASQVRWTKMGDIFMSRFEDPHGHYIAYFRKDGTLILTGKKIAFDNVPMSVKQETERVQNVYANDGHALSVRETYELAHNGTEYYMNLTSQALDLSILVDGDGTSSRVLKKAKKAEAEIIKPVLAADARNN